MRTRTIDARDPNVAGIAGIHTINRAPGTRNSGVVTRGLGGRKRVFMGYSAWRTGLLIVLGFGTGLSPALHANGGRHTRVFAPAPCPVAFPAGMRVDCGFLVVPENRRDQGEAQFRSSRKEIRIAVAIARALSGVPVPDPIVFVPEGRVRTRLTPVPSSISPRSSATTAM